MGCGNADEELERFFIEETGFTDRVGIVVETRQSRKRSVDFGGKICPAEVMDSNFLSRDRRFGVDFLFELRSVVEGPDRVDVFLALDGDSLGTRMNDGAPKFVLLLIPAGESNGQQACREKYHQKAAHQEVTCACI